VIPAGFEPATFRLGVGITHIGIGWMTLDGSKNQGELFNSMQ
jgi:hypothetical protein